MYSLKILPLLAVALTLALPALPSLHAAPSITATGDLNTYPSPNPTSGPWNAGPLTVGNTGTGALTIEGGASVTSSVSRLGYQPGSDGTITVTGAGSSWVASSFLFDIGSFGTGTLTIADGASATSGKPDGSGSVALGANPGSTGTVLVTGTNSIWTVQAPTLEVGRGGAGNLTIADGATFIAQRAGAEFGDISIEGNAPGTMRITGANSTATVRALMLKAQSSLTIEAGGGLAMKHSGQLFNGSTASVTGAGSSLRLDGQLIVNGALQIAAAATVSSGATMPGEGFSANISSDNVAYEGKLTVTGTGSTWTNTLDTYVGTGSGNRGSLVIEAGASASDRNGRLGVNNPSGSGIGTALVTGTGSTWTHSADLFVGQDGTGNLTVADGGSVSDVNGHIGANAGSTGTALVTGTNSTWANTGDLKVGQGGTGTLTVADGGAVSVTGALTVHGAGDKLTLGGGIVTADGGVFILADATLGGEGTIDGDLSLASGAKFTFDLNKTLTVNGTVSMATSFGITSLIGLDATTADGTYTLLDGTTTDFSALGLQNWGYDNRYRLSADGDPYKAAYFEQGSLVVKVVPEPGTTALLLLGLGVALFTGARRLRK